MIDRAQTHALDFVKEHPDLDPRITAAIILTVPLHAIALRLKELGLNNASTEMGAIEALSLSVKEGLQSLSDSNDGIAAAISDLDMK